MARELSQEAVLDFLWGAGGRAPNSALLRHFQRFLRDPALSEQQRRERREYFKSLVNSLATVRPAAGPGASKDIVLRRRYRDLLDEDMPPPEQQDKEEEEKEERAPPLRRDPDGRRGPPGEAAAGKGRPARAAGAGGCAAQGRGGPCCECRRALRAAAAPSPGRGARPPAGPPQAPPPPAQPPPYRSQPLSWGAGALRPAEPPRSRSPPPARPSQPQSPPQTPIVSLPPQRPRESLPAQPLRSCTAVPSPNSRPQPRSPQRPPAGTSPPPSGGPGGQRPSGASQSPLLSSGVGVLLPDSQPQPRSLPQPPTGMPLLKASPPSVGPEGQHPTRASRAPQPPPPLSLPLQSVPGVLSRSLQELPATPFPLLSSGPDVLPSTRLPPSQSRSLQQLPTRPSHSPPRSSRLLTPNGPTGSQVLLLYPYQTLPLPPGPGVLPPTRPVPSQSPRQSSTQTSPSRALKPPPARPPPSQSLLPAAAPQAPESSPPASLPVFRSIRCQLALLEVQGTPPWLPDYSGRQPRTVPSKSSPRKVPSRGLSVPLGQREHAWLVAASAGCWARVRGLFLEEPELVLQRDFMSGFTVLHWMAKHGDGPGLQELAAAARQAGLALDVDVRSGCGYTPLHLAAIHGHQFVIKVLVLQLGCQVQVRDSSGRRPWEYLGSSTSGEIWQLLEAPRGTIMFPTEPLACSTSSVSKTSLPAGKAALPACLWPQHGRGAASHQTGKN